MARRLKLVKRCAVCAIAFRPFHRAQPTCSHACGGIRNAKLYPKHHAMHAVNAVKRARFDAGLAQALAGLSLVEAFKKGQVRGYRTAHQKFSRERRAA